MGRRLVFGDAEDGDEHSSKRLFLTAPTTTLTLSALQSPSLDIRPTARPPTLVDYTQSAEITTGAVVPSTMVHLRKNLKRLTWDASPSNCS
jgi:hypothetical protein